MKFYTWCKTCGKQVSNEPGTCKHCGTQHLGFLDYRKPMFGPGPTGCELHSSICSTCHYDRSMLKDWLNGGDRDKALDASLIIGDCPECSKYFEKEG